MNSRDQLAAAFGFHSFGASDDEHSGNGGGRGGGALGITIPGRLESGIQVARPSYHAKSERLSAPELI